MVTFWVCAGISYWIIGVYVSCWGFYHANPHSDLDGEIVGLSMFFGWIIWPMILFATLLMLKFNR